MYGPLSGPCPGPPGEPVSPQLTIGALLPAGRVGHSSIPCVTVSVPGRLRSFEKIE